MRTPKWLFDAVADELHYGLKDQLEKQLSEKLENPSGDLKQYLGDYFHANRWLAADHDDRAADRRGPRCLTVRSNALLALRLILLFEF